MVFRAGKLCVIANTNLTFASNTSPGRNFPNCKKITDTNTHEGLNGNGDGHAHHREDFHPFCHHPYARILVNPTKEPQDLSFFPLIKKKIKIKTVGMK